MFTIILGTRPEIIKLAPIIHEASRRDIPVHIIHTGQHYAPELDRNFFLELSLPEPARQIQAGSHPPARQVGVMMERLYGALVEARASMVMVQGDTNSVLAGALAAVKMGIPVAHLEAGLRSDDWTMPEELNRVVTDRISRWLFCPTDTQTDRLRREDVTHDGVHVVGNTIVDALYQYKDEASRRSSVRNKFGLNPATYILCTMHRPSNVDDPERLTGLLTMLNDLCESRSWKIVFPIHPRTKHQLEKRGITLGSAFCELEPVGFLDLLDLEANAAMIVTDSGGIQEESCILQVPCITLRENTERPETLAIGSNMLYGGTDPEAFGDMVEEMLRRPTDWVNPYGDGKTAQRVMDILSRN